MILKTNTSKNGEPALVGSIETENVSKDFGKFRALDSVSLQIMAGEFLTLLGPSGSGKTTFLMLLSGFEHASSGRLYLDGTDMTELPPEKRGFGMVFQGYALFPHMSVADNIAFPLKVQGRGSREIKGRVADMIDMVGLAAHGHKMPSALSGGQQQRVALARALACEPPVLLLDEPFSALDKNLRGQMQEEMRRIHRDLGTTFVFVTHDQSEALALSSHVAIFDHGKLQQFGAPEEVYEHPANQFVAEFLGEINILSAEISGNDAVVEGQHLRLPEDNRSRGSNSYVAIRPEHMTASLDEVDHSHNSLKAKVIDIIYQGNAKQLILNTTGGSEISMLVPVDHFPDHITPGTDVWTSWEVDKCFVL